MQGCMLDTWYVTEVLLKCINYLYSFCPFNMFKIMIIRSNYWTAFHVVHSTKKEQTTTTTKRLGKNGND